MFGFGLFEILFLLVLALILIGPKQLPEVARALAKLINELKRLSEEIMSPMEDLRDLKNRPREYLKEVLTEPVQDSPAATPPTSAQDSHFTATTSPPMQDSPSASPIAVSPAAPDGGPPKTEMEKHD